MKFVVLFALITFALADVNCDSLYEFNDESGNTYVFDIESMMTSISSNSITPSDYDGWLSFSSSDSTKTWYFTPYSCATETTPCPDGANACVMDTVAGTTTVIGTFQEITSSLTGTGDEAGMSIVSVGDGCSKTAINLVCNMTQDITVESEGCYTTITISSGYACPSMFGVDDGNMPDDTWRDGGIIMFAIMFSLIVTGVCACLLITMCIVGCYRCCTNKKYKKRQDIMLQDTKVAFQPLPTQEPVQMVRYAPVSPLHPMTQLPFQYQYMQQPMMYFPQQQQQPAQIGQHTEEQIDEDAKLARKLQAELNA